MVTGRAGASAQEVRFCRSRDGVQDRLRPPRLGAAARDRHVLVEPPAARLAEPGVAALPRRPGRVRDGDPLRRARPRSVRLGRRGPLLEARVADLEAVVEDAGVDRFALMAMSQGGPVVIDYAVRHPERITRLLFYGSHASAFVDPTPEQLEMAATLEQMIKVGWARPDSAFRRVFTSMMIPGASEEQMRWLDELQRMSVSAETAVLARRQRRPGQRRRPAAADRRADAGAALPRRPDERFRRQPAAGGQDPRRPTGAARQLEPHRARARSRRGHVPRRGACVHGARPASSAATPAARRRRRLSAREVEVLRLAAEGLDNEGIAAALDAERAHGRAPPAEHLHQARRAGEVGTGRRRRPLAHACLTATRSPPPAARRARREWVVAPMRPDRLDRLESSPRPAARSRTKERRHDHDRIGSTDRRAASSWSRAGGRGGGLRAGAGSQRRAPRPRRELGARSRSPTCASAGLLAIAVPVELGGRGASLRQVSMVQRELAKHCASTALATAMHQHVTAFTAWRYRRGLPGAEATLRRVAGEGIVLVSTGGADWTDPRGTAIKVDGGYVVSGRKSFASQSPAGTVMSTMFTYDDPERGLRVLNMAVPMADEHVRVLRQLGHAGHAGHGQQRHRRRRRLRPRRAGARRSAARRRRPAAAGDRARSGSA